VARVKTRGGLLAEKILEGCRILDRSKASGAKPRSGDGSIQEIGGAPRVKLREGEVAESMIERAGVGVFERAEPDLLERLIPA